jgi:hypothetical protein
MHGVASEWAGKLGNHHSAKVTEHGPNFAIGRLNLPEDMRTFDVSGMGPGTNVEESGNVEDSGEAEEQVGENPYFHQMQADDEFTGRYISLLNMMSGDFATLPAFFKEDTDGDLIASTVADVFPHFHSTVGMGQILWMCLAFLV